ncbi:MAG: hypothetical protein MJ158_02320, partial [Alphaproteobacteria bacterium]|nr:hypothetical protein [Alphaproteobacteria bacterium]
MKYFTKTVSLLAIIMGIPSVFAATNARISATTTATRFPTIAGRMSSVTNGVVTTTGISTTAASLLDSAECIDSYTSCMKGSEACGPDFEECTTNVLFHGKMPQCFSTLYQCSATGINNLFGTSTITALGNVKSQNASGEVTAYTYPTDGSVLGQLISGSAISNRYDAADCVKKYKKCLYKESVCGEDFELCTSDSEFRKQSVFCDSVLGRCQSDGINQLFGQTAKPNGAGSALVKQWMEDGADLAAANAVQTCFKVVDACFMNACAANPLRCVEGTNLKVVGEADFVANGTESVVVDTSTGVDTQDAGAIKKFFKSSCMDTIGKNKYCHMTFKETATVKASELADIDEQEDVFSDAFAARRSNLNSKLQDIVTKFDTKAKDKCRDTIVSCAMKMCGSGVGSLCYSDVFDGGDNTINGTNTYGPIKTGCEGIVNLDANCKYAAATTKASGYAYTYNDVDTFSTLFPQYDGSTAIAQQVDPVGAIGTLNGKLSSSYNEAAIADLKKQCQNVAVSCVRSMCGKDYINCYRNRTDIVSGTYNTTESAFDKSMNKMGGVLDYNIVIGLCLQTVQNSSTCEEHLKIAGAKWRRDNANDSALWGSSVRDSWLGGNTTSAKADDSGTIVTGCKLPFLLSVGIV